MQNYLWIHLGKLEEKVCNSKLFFLYLSTENIQQWCNKTKLVWWKNCAELALMSWWGKSLAFMRVDVQYCLISGSLFWAKLCYELPFPLSIDTFIDIKYVGGKLLTFQLEINM